MNNLIKKLKTLNLDHCMKELSILIKSKQDLLHRGYGIEEKYLALNKMLPDLSPSVIDLNDDWVTIGSAVDTDEKSHSLLMEVLRDHMPWRKGPFDIFGIKVDTEWASNIKWDRIKDALTPLEGKKVLDIGCGSGYHLFRIAGHNPSMALGLDPMINYHYQFNLIQHYLKNDNIFHLPAKFEELPQINKYFDTVFHMGVLYHLKSPIESLKAIKSVIAPDGELIIETLIIEGDSNTALFPEDRYAKMRNVFFIPTVNCLKAWLKRSGYKNIRCIDVSPTTSLEQRKTEWIENQSLDDFLDPDDKNLTIEGYPAPVRAMFIANPK